MAPIRPNAEDVSALADAAKLAADAASMAAAAASLLAGEQGPIAAIPLSADPAWRHPCFVDAIAAEFTATHPATTKRLTTALGLGFAADLLQLAASSLAAPLKPHAEPIESALRRGLALVPPVRSGGAKEMHKLLSSVVAELRALPVGGGLVLPSGWSTRDEVASVLMVVHRAAADTWDLAVVSVSAGLEYHPQHAAPPHGQPAYQVSLLLRSLSSARGTPVRRLEP